MMRIDKRPPGLAILLLSAGLTLVSAAGAAWAVGDDDAAPPTCKRGEVYDKKLRKCVRKEAANLADDELADYAYALAKAGRYDETLAVLATSRDPNTAKALNYRGYATRKLGRTEEGIGYYLRSVKLDPNYAKVREYLGEAYVIQGRRDLANEQLAVIQTLCGRECEEYRDLAAALANRDGRVDDGTCGPDGGRPVRADAARPFGPADRRRPPGHGARDATPVCSTLRPGST